MDLELSGQTAVIVGAARGIGRAIATEFAAEGCNVAVLDRDPGVLVVASELDSIIACRRWHSPPT